MLTLIVAVTVLAHQEITQTQVAIRALDACDKGPYSALLTIRAVNDVVSLGPAKSKELLDIYFKQLGVNGQGNLFPFIRCIFDIPKNPGFLPVPNIGSWDPMPPSSLKTSPRFPIGIIGNIPFFIAASSKQLAGAPEPEARHYIRLSTMATLRTTKLVPVDHPWRLMPRTSLPDNIDFGAGRAGMNHDVLVLVSTAYRPKNYNPNKPSWYTDKPVGWRYVVAQMEAVNMHWDRNREMYVRADGTTLQGS